ncbi:MAG: Tm-1-like ATP-binding domain-containing protein, partial [Propionicimonas sp.]|nr:Tm-1-like ATP-binding domain-containing protein [Propionicimonas sp.]
MTELTHPDPTTVIALLGAFDTKGVELRYVRELIERRGFEVFVIDISVVGDGEASPAVGPADIARAGGRELGELVRLHDRGEAIATMTRGAGLVAKAQWEAGRFDAILSLGGGAGTVVGTAAMRALPF